MTQRHQGRRENNHQGRKIARKRLFASSCSNCGRRTEDGAALCPTCAQQFGRKPMTEAQRIAAHPERQHYKSPTYRANRLERIAMTRKTLSGPQVRAGYVARCETCSTPVRDGEFECDHVITILEWTQKPLPGDPNAIGNLRIKCTVRPNRCHHIKTADGRRDRRV